MTGFDQVFAPLGNETFLREYWLKTFAHIQGERGRFAGLLGWEELSAILEAHRLTPPRLKLYREGHAIDPAQYLTPAMFGVPRLDAGGLAVALAQGASLVLDDAEELAPRVRALAASFQDALHTDTHVNLYAGWQRQNAFATHWDAQEAVVIQVAGRKHWQVYQPTRLYPLKNDVEAPLPPTDPPVWDGILEDGDVLYIPRGWWHVAAPLNEPSLHLTFSLTPPTGMDYLGWTVAHLRRHAEVRASLQAGDDRAAAKLRSLIGDLLTAKTLNEFLEEWDANIRPNPHIRLPGAAYRQLAPVTAEDRVRLAALHRLSLKPDGDGFCFPAAGRLWTVPRGLESALKKLRNNHSHSVAELGGSDELIKSLGVLARAGVILLEIS
jgi:hypothetical protein